MLIPTTKLPNPNFNNNPSFIPAFIFITNFSNPSRPQLPPTPFPQWLTSPPMTALGDFDTQINSCHPFPVPNLPPTHPKIFQDPVSSVAPTLLKPDLWQRRQQRLVATFPNLFHSELYFFKALKWSNKVQMGREVWDKCLVSTQFFFCCPTLKITRWNVLLLWHGETLTHPPLCTTDFTGNCSDMSSRWQRCSPTPLLLVVINLKKVVECSGV